MDCDTRRCQRGDRAEFRQRWEKLLRESGRGGEGGRVVMGWVSGIGVCSSGVGSDGEVRCVDYCTVQQSSGFNDGDG